MGDIKSPNQAVTLQAMSEKVREYSQKGFHDDVQKAIKLSRGETREWIEHQHPAQGKITSHGKVEDLIIDNYNGVTHHQTVLGHYAYYKNYAEANIYANYFQRWYNTGVRGMRAQGSWWRSNQQGTERKFIQQLDTNLEKFIDL